MINWLLRQPFNLHSIHPRILERITLKKIFSKVTRQGLTIPLKYALAFLSDRMSPLVGSVAERLNAPVLKTGNVARRS